MDCHNQSNGTDGCILVLTGFELCLAVFALIAWITVRRARRNSGAKTENEGGESSRGLILLRHGNSVVQTQLTGGMGTTWNHVRVSQTLTICKHIILITSTSSRLLVFPLFELVIYYHVYLFNLARHQLFRSFSLNCKSGKYSVQFPGVPLHRTGSGQ